MLLSLLKKMPGVRALCCIASSLENWFLVRFKIELYYKIKCSRSILKVWPNLDHPTIYAEKMIWLICRWRHPLKSVCADKFAVRKYVEDNGLGDMLVPLLGVWDSAESIDFNLLPHKFVLKCNHGCGYNIICHDKAQLDVVSTRKRLKKWMKESYGWKNGEIHYNEIKPKIICEEFLDAGHGELPSDFKCFCFNGHFFCCDVITGRPKHWYDHADGGMFHEFVYDANWNRKFLLRNEEPETCGMEMPDGYAKMVKAAEILSKPFPAVRVDFYCVAGKVYFGELTFTSSGGLGVGWSDYAQRVMGELISLPSAIY